MMNETEPTYLRYMKPAAREFLLEYERSVPRVFAQVDLDKIELAVIAAVGECRLQFVNKLQAELARMFVHTGDMRQMLDDMGYS